MLVFCNITLLLLLFRRLTREPPQNPRRNRPVQLDDLAQRLRSIGLSDDLVVLADMSSKLREIGVMALEDLQDSSDDEVKELVSPLNLNSLQLKKLFRYLKNPKP